MPVRVPVAAPHRAPRAAYPLVRVVLAGGVMRERPAFRLDDAAAPGEPFPFTFRGVAYVVPPVAAWPVGVMDLATGGRLRESVAVLLGDEAAERLTADGLTVGHLTALFEQMGKP